MDWEKLFSSFFETVFGYVADVASKLSLDDKRKFVKLFFSPRGKRIKVHGLTEKRLPVITFDTLLDFNRIEEIAKISRAGETLVKSIESIISVSEGSNRCAWKT